MYVPCLNCGGEFDEFSVYLYIVHTDKMGIKTKGKKEEKKNPWKYLDIYLFHFMTGIHHSREGEDRRKCSSVWWNTWSICIILLIQAKSQLVFLFTMHSIRWMWLWLSFSSHVLSNSKLNFIFIHIHIYAYEIIYKHILCCDMTVLSCNMHHRYNYHIWNNLLTILSFYVNRK